MSEIAKAGVVPAMMIATAAPQTARNNRTIALPASSELAIPAPTGMSEAHYASAVPACSVCYDIEMTYILVGERLSYDQAGDSKLAGSASFAGPFKVY